MTTLGKLFTETDEATGDWMIDDEVVQLREWGTWVTYRLPPSPVAELTIGTDPACGLQLADRSGGAPAVHARLVRDGARWRLVEDAGHGGDGGQRATSVLAPGHEIAIGGVTLIAESPASIALHNFLARLLGWEIERLRHVDHALQAIRLAATCRAALILWGDGDLVPIAQAIHRRSRGPDRPFVMCDPQRHPGKATIRCVENCATGMEALAAAAGGSLCIRSHRLPPDFAEVVQALFDRTSRAQFIVCSGAARKYERCRVTPIAIPLPTSRPREIDRIIDEYAHDAMVALSTSRTVFQGVDRAWVRQHASATLPEIEITTLRLVALRASRNLNQAAARLGMAAVSLDRWIGRRPLPVSVR